MDWILTSEFSLTICTHDLLENRTWTEISTMRMVYGFIFKAIAKYSIACICSLYYLISVTFLLHTVFFSYTSMYIAVCKQVLFTHVYTFGHSIEFYSGRISLQLSDLPGCKTVECICGLVRVYLNCLIIHFTGSLIL